MPRENPKVRNPWDAPLAGGAPPRGAAPGALPILLGAAALVLVVTLLYASGVRGKSLVNLHPQTPQAVLRPEFLGADQALFQHSPLVEPPTAPGAGSSLPRWLPHAVTTLSLVVDRALWGPLPAGFRATNVLLHALATLAAFALFLRWSGRRLTITVMWQVRLRMRVARPRARGRQRFSVGPSSA